MAKPKVETEILINLCLCFKSGTCDLKLVPKKNLTRCISFGTLVFRSNFHTSKPKWYSAHTCLSPLFDISINWYYWGNFPFDNTRHLFYNLCLPNTNDFTALYIVTTNCFYVHLCMFIFNFWVFIKNGPLTVKNFIIWVFKLSNQSMWYLIFLPIHQFYPSYRI